MNRAYLHLLPPLLLAALLALLLARLAAAGGPGVGPAAAPPIPETNITFDSDVLSVAVQGDYAYVGLESGLVILDITNPLQPVRRGFLDTNVGLPPHFVGSPCCLQIEGDLLVISNNTYIATVDVSDPAHPQLLSPYQQYSNLAIPFRLLNKYLYIVEGGRFHIIDLHDPTHPQEIYRLDDQHLIGDITSIDAEVNSLDGHTYVYMGGREWCYPSIGCSGNAFLVADVTDPTAPYIRSQYQGTYISAVRIEDNYLYLTDLSSSLPIYDATDPFHLQFVGDYQDSEGEFLSYLEVAGNRLAVGGQHRDVIFNVDVSDKLSPQELSIHRNVNFMDLSISREKNCVLLAEGERGLHILCEAQAHPQPPALVWLPMVQAQSEG